MTQAYSNTKPLYQRLATLLQAVANCKQSKNLECQERHGERAIALVREYMPSGSGFDGGTELSERSTPNKLVFHTSFHHMDENGSYDGWTDHRVIVRPSLAFSIELTVTGPDRNDIKSLIHDSFDLALRNSIAEELASDIALRNSMAEDKA
jgi:hypothetical protein